jgi:hypothetical protein
VGKLFTFIVLLLAVVAGLFFSPFSKGLEVNAVTKKLASVSRDIGLFEKQEKENLTGVFVSEKNKVKTSEEEIDSLIKSAPTLDIKPDSDLAISPFGKELISKGLSQKSPKQKSSDLRKDALIKSLQERIAISDEELAETAADNRQLAKKVESLKGKLNSRAQPSSSAKVDDPQATIRMLKDSEADLLRKVVEYRKEVRTLSRKLSAVEQKPASSSSTSELNRLKKEVISLKGKLKLKEEEISALSSGKPLRPRPTQTKSQPAAASSAPVATAVATAVSTPAPTRVPLATATATKSSARDMRVKVTVPKANLRTGPGKKHGVVTQIAKGVVLSAESRSGSWFRVLDPTGKRAFISADVVRLLKPQTRSSLAPRKTEKPALKPRQASRVPVPEGFVPFEATRPAATGPAARTATKQAVPKDAEQRAFDQLKQRLSR